MFSKEKKNSSSNYPGLRNAKAMDSRQLSSFVYIAFAAHARPDVDVDQQLLRCLSCLCDFYELTSRAHGRYLSEVHALKVSTAVNHALAHYNWLTHWGDSGKSLLL